MAETKQHKKRRGRPKTVDRERTVQLATVNYWREGLHALSLNQLCVRTEISKPALYREFDNEDGLMKAALEHYRQIAVLPLLMFLDSEHSFAEILEQVIVGMTSKHDHPTGCLFTQMRLAGSRLGPLTAKHVRSIERERHKAFESWYRRALVTQEVDPSIAPKLAASYIDTQFTSVLVQMKAGTLPDAVRTQARLAFRVLLPPPTQ